MKCDNCRYRKMCYRRFNPIGDKYSHTDNCEHYEEYEERPHGKCRTCKHYTPYREQFSYRYRGDGYCKSTITTSEGQAYINCHDEWYCANYEKEGEKND